MKFRYSRILIMSAAFLAAGLSGGSAKESRIGISSLQDFSVRSITPRIFSPNSDSRNDLLELEYLNPMDSIVNGKIYNLQGGLVAEMIPGTKFNTLVWDGNNRNGSTVQAGIYLYQLEITGPESKVFKGIIIVAK